MILVLMFLQTVVEVFFINFCFQTLLKTATDCCQAEWHVGDTP